MEKFDLVVIGSGSAGEKAAVKAAYFGYKVALIEKKGHISGSKDPLLLHLLKHVPFEKFLERKDLVVLSHEKVVEKNLLDHEVKIYYGAAKFENTNTIMIEEKKICTDNILIATGSKPKHFFEKEYDQKTLFDTETIFEIDKTPKTIGIIGANELSFTFATLFAYLGSKVSLFLEDQKLNDMDEDIYNALIKSMERKKVSIIKEKLKSLSDYKQIDVFVDAYARVGNAEGLEIENAGIRLNSFGFIDVDEHYCTTIPHIFAAGDVIGQPSCASNSMDQGRIAVAKMFQIKDVEHISSACPRYLYTMPEVSYVGKTEKQLIDKKINYCVGRSFYPNMDLGVITKTDEGELKLLFDPVTLQIYGVHIIGKHAGELIHYGTLLIENLKTLSYLTCQVFNYPTFHELYKYAAFDGLGNLSGHKIK